MMKNALRGSLAFGLLALVGCGPTVDDVVGTWMYDDPSTLISDCGDAGKTETDLAGGSVVFALGAEHDLTDGDSDCAQAFSFSGGEIHAEGYEGAGCTGEEGALPEGYTSEGEIYWVYSSEGDAAKLVPTGEVSVTGNDITCTVSYDASLTKM